MTTTTQTAELIYTAEVHAGQTITTRPGSRWATTLTVATVKESAMRDTNGRPCIFLADASGDGVLLNADDTVGVL